jgi:hypothetical protein
MKTNKIALVVTITVILACLSSCESITKALSLLNTDYEEVEFSISGDGEDQEINYLIEEFSDDKESEKKSVAGTEEYGIFYDHTVNNENYCSKDIPTKMFIRVKKNSKIILKIDSNSLNGTVFINGDL